MRAWIFAVPLVLVSSMSAAQSQQSSQPGLGYVSAHNESANRARLNGGAREECLIRISDRKRVCHTRAEWQRIAAQIDAGGQAR